MTTAEVLTHPGPIVPSAVPTHDGDALKLDQEAPAGHVHAQSGTYTAAEVLEVALAAYQRGRDDASSQAGRDRWARAAVVDAFRAARIAAEVALMKASAASHYLARGYPEGYDYRGGPVDFETGMPLGSACAWLRRQHSFGLAGGSE